MNKLGTAMAVCAESSPLLRPLQKTGRYRETLVEQQIQSLLSCTAVEFRRRLRVKDRSADDYLREETLVYFLRERQHAGDTHAAGEIARLLVERSAGFLARNLTCWRQLAPHQVEDCLRDAQMRMIQDLFSEDAQCEFWEVRFWLCLKRRLLNCVARYNRTADNEIHPEPPPESAGAPGDWWETRLSDAAPTPHECAELGEALSLLSERERQVFVLYHAERWTQQEIAQQLQITDRTVRNILGRAEARLQQWRQTGVP